MTAFIKRTPDMNTWRTWLNHVPKILGLAAIGHIVLFDTLIITAPDWLQVQFTPDDAYYYLGVVRGFLRFGNWTFDNMNSLTTGFHLLFAYFLCIVKYIFRPTDSEFVRYAVSSGAVSTVVFLVLAWIVGIKLRYSYYYFLGIALIGSTKNFTYNSVACLEWPFVILCAFFYYAYLDHCLHLPPQSISKRQMIIILGIGWLGSLARTDFGLVPVSFLVAFLIRGWWPHYKALIKAALWGCVGATLGVSSTFIHNYLFTGVFFQSSARMKAYWSQLKGHSYHSVSELLLNIVGINTSFLPIHLIFPLLVSLLLFIGIGSIIASKKRHSSRHSFRREHTLLIVSLCIIVGYVLLYGSHGTRRQWYTGHLVVPVVVVFVTCCAWLDRWLKGSVIFRRGVLVITVLLMLANLLSIYPVTTHNSPWPHQHIMLQAGKYLRQHPLDGKVGSWNAGIIGYYQGGEVINLDGLVNNDIYEYAVHNTLPVYLREQGIHYIIDFRPMFEVKMFRLRGGYDQKDFLAALHPLIVFDQGLYGWRYLTLFRFEAQEKG